MTQQDGRAELLTSFVERCPPVELPSAWDFLEADPDVRCLPEDTRQITDELESEYGRELLESANLIVPAESGYQLNPIFTSVDKILWLARDADCNAFEIVTSLGTLRNDFPFFVAFYDLSTCDRIRDGNYFFLTPTMEDVVILRALGLPAAPATRLDRMGRISLGHLLYMTGGRGNDQIPRTVIASPALEKRRLSRLGPKDDTEPVFWAALSCYSLWTGERIVHEKIKDVAEYIDSAKRSLGISFQSLLAWMPSQEEQNKLMFLRQMRSADILRQHFCKSKEFFPVEHILRLGGSRVSGQSLTKALSELVVARDDVVRSGYGTGEKNPRDARERLELAEKDYSSLVDEILLDPLMKSALEVNDPRSRVLKIQLAHVVQRFHQKLPEMDLNASGNDISSGGDKGLVPPEKLKQFEIFTNSIVKLIREDGRLQKSLGIWPRNG